MRPKRSGSSASTAFLRACALESSRDGAAAGPARGPDRAGLSGGGHWHGPLCLHAGTAHDAGRRPARSAPGQRPGQQQLPGLPLGGAGLRASALAVAPAGLHLGTKLRQPDPGRAAGHHRADPGDGAALASNLGRAALGRGAGQRLGVCLHLRLVPVAAEPTGPLALGRGDLRRAGRRHHGQRPGRQPHGGAGLALALGLAGHGSAGLAGHSAGLAGARRAACAGRTHRGGRPSLRTAGPSKH
jgi:hypothetical protein